MIYDFVNELLESFYRKTVVHTVPEGDRSPLYVHLESWIESGAAIKATGGDRSLYLDALIRLLAIAETDDRFAGKFELPLINLEEDGSQWICLEPRFWTAALERYKLGLRGSIT